MSFISPQSYSSFSFVCFTKNQHSCLRQLLFSHNFTIFWYRKKKFTKCLKCLIWNEWFISTKKNEIFFVLFEEVSKQQTQNFCPSYDLFSFIKQKNSFNLSSLKTKDKQHQEKQFQKVMKKKQILTHIIFFYYI